MIRTTLKTLESRTTQFSFTYSRRAQSSWIPPSKRRSVRYGSCSTTSTSTATQQQQQQHQSQRRPVVVNGKTLPFHVNDLKKTQHQHQHHVATTTTSSSSFSSQQQHNKNGSSNNNNIKPLRKYESDLIVVLDMDECLIHSQFLQDSPGAKYAHQVQQRSGGGDGGDGEKSSSSSTNSVDTFNITLPDGERVLVHKRPYLHEFLKEVSSKYETHIFTAAMEVYAKPVLNILDPHGDIFTNIYYRESCQLNSTVGAYVKNLGGLGLFCDDDSDSHSNNNENTNNNKRRLNRTVLVDNNPLR
ncbi:MAG: TFIIF-interacting CTD phosphatase-like protein [Bacillariaceae sp.]|jgi:TFIIF-interacting CTD phosphatase-like protein